MSIIYLHTISKESVIRNDQTSLCVFNEDGNLVATYDFCTGLRLLRTEHGVTVYIHEVDLIPGPWVLLVAVHSESNDVTTTRIEGTHEGPQAAHVLLDDNPWDGCLPGDRVGRVEREERLSLCKSCPFLNLTTMTCAVSEKPVLDETTKADTYCPQELWGDKQKVLADLTEQSKELGLVSNEQTTVINSQDQLEFEDELANYLEGLQ